MKKVFLTGIFLVAGLASSLLLLVLLPAPFDRIFGFGCAVFTLFMLVIPKKKSGKIKIGPFSWTVNDFCRGWLITGQTGSGKTASAIRTILHELFRQMPEFGGAVVDQKGQFYEIVSGTAKHYGLEDKLVILRVGEGANAKYNLLSYPGISWASYAAIIVDTAESMGMKSEGIWKTGSEGLLRGILQMISTYRLPTLKDLVDFTNNLTRLEDMVKKVLNDPAASQEARNGALDLDGQIIKMTPVTRDGIIANAQKMVTYFSDPDIQEVFCPKENTVDFRDIDKGKIFVLSMPQKFDRQRIFFNTFLKLLFTTHAKYRFDDPKTLREKNLLVFLADEAQQIVTSSFFSSDHEAVSVIREAKATFILATQSVTSLDSRLKKEDAATLILNLSSKIYYTVADAAASEIASKDLGCQKSDDMSYSVSKGVTNISHKEVEKPVYSPAELRALKKFQCIIKHPSGETEKLYLPPRDDNGNIPDYYYKERFSFLWYPLWLLQV